MTHVGIYGADRSLIYEGEWESEDAVRVLNEQPRPCVVWVALYASPPATGLVQDTDVVALPLPPSAGELRRI